MEDEESALDKYVSGSYPSWTSRPCPPRVLDWWDSIWLFMYIHQSPGCRFLNALSSWEPGIMKSLNPAKSGGRDSKLNASNKVAQDGWVHTELVLG